MPAGKAIHAILDNYATHKHPKVRAWLARHPRWTFHFTPTSCSWLNAVEGFFAKLTRRRLKRGVFHSVVDLQAAINRFVREHNAENPNPSSGKPIPTTSSPPSTAGTKRWNQSTSESRSSWDKLEKDIYERLNGISENIRKKDEIALALNNQTQSSSNKSSGRTLSEMQGMLFL